MIIYDGKGERSSTSVTITVTEPSIEITNPADNSVVSEKITIAAKVIGLSGQTVNFYLNGEPLGSPDSNAPYQASLPTKDLSVGLHLITAKVISEG
ncbi:MAG: Ig-like domain-containing protein [Nitrosopumilus sp.]|nr:Ig-like domain-containing protein [Nitrosopumilus sp.]